MKQYGAYNLPPSCSCRWLSSPSFLGLPIAFKAFKKCLIFLSDLVEMSNVRPNQEGVVTGLEREYITLLRGREQMLVSI